MRQPPMLTGSFALVLGALGCVSGAAPEITSVRDAAVHVPPDASADATPPAPFDGWTPFPDVPSYEAAPVEKVVVYAHTGSDLLSVDPMTMQISRIGSFIIPGPPDQYLNDVTDIAVDRSGRIVGTTFNHLLQIDPMTATCKQIAALPPGRSFNGLSWIRADAGDEQLYATTLDGNVFRLDPMSGAATLVGPLGGGLQSSGDLVSVENYGTLVTVKGPKSDRLARLDPRTGAATIIGDTNFQQIWGLGFWGSRVYGFTSTGQFILIDPKTGAGTLVMADSAYPYYGAGVTTSVPVIF